MILRLKKIIENIPAPIGSSLKYIPFSIRLGKQYNFSRESIYDFQNLSRQVKKEYILKRIRKIVEYAVENIHFYREHYNKHNFNLEQLETFADIRKIPIVTKEDLKHYLLEDRSSYQKGRIITNTGGTSGEPLEFYLDSSAFAREWAHMHYIWSKLNYNKIDLKLTFRGKNLGNQPVKYNPIHNEYLINSYLPVDELANKILKVLERQPYIYIHGYPSAIYNFALYCASENEKLLEMLREKTRGVLLGSEFPAPVYRDVIEEVFQAETLSWYGHSEMALLAYEENEKYIYKPLQTYGYCEAVQLDDKDYRLVGTSYDNAASPFIRYDTGDLVTPVNSSELLEGFKISAGRVGEFIIDSKGHKVSLTALIFGRHHKIFQVARYIQVKQDSPGKATVYVVLPQNTKSSIIDWTKKFDSSNVNIDFDFKTINEPILSKLGKVPLLIQSSDEESD